MQDWESEPRPNWRADHIYDVAARAGIEDGRPATVATRRTDHLPGDGLGLNRLDLLGALGGLHIEGFGDWRGLEGSNVKQCQVGGQLCQVKPIRVESRVEWQDLLYLYNTMRRCWSIFNLSHESRCGCGSWHFLVRGQSQELIPTTHTRLGDALWATRLDPTQL